MERFELLPDDHDDDSIFSESSADKYVSDDAPYAIDDHMHHDLPTSLFMPYLQSRQQHYVRRKMEENALVEEMSSPSKSRHDQPKAAADEYTDPTFKQSSIILQPAPNAVSVFPQRSSLGDVFERSRSDQARALETSTHEPAIPYPKFIGQNLTSNQPSDLESMTSSSVDSEVKYLIKQTKPSSASSNNTANTAETSSSDLSQKSHGNSNESFEYEFSPTAANASPTTTIYGLIDDLMKEDSDSNANVKQESAAGTPRSASAEKPGLANHHRTARYRVAAGAISEQPRRVLLNDVNSEIIIQKGCMEMQGGMSMEEKRALAIALEQLRIWKMNASKELDNQKRELETLRQFAAEHASKVGLLKSEAAKKDELHRDEVSVLQSQLSAIASNFAEQTKIHDARNDEISELEQVLERTKSDLLAREMALSTKNEEIAMHVAEVERLKSELLSMFSARKKCRSVETDSVDDTSSELILELSEENERLELRVKELEAQLKQSNQKNIGCHEEIDRLDVSIDSTSEYHKKLREETEAASLAAMESCDEKSSLNDKRDGLLVEAKTANWSIESPDHITSLCEEMNGCVTLASQVSECEERQKEEQIPQQLAESKKAPNKVTRAEAKYLSLKLLNEFITSERDELVQWKQDAEEKLQTLAKQVDELTSQTISLQIRCNEQKTAIFEKEALINNLEKVKSTPKNFAVAQYVEEMTERSKDISSPKVKCEEMELLTSKCIQDDRLSKLEKWQNEARATIKCKSNEIQYLIAVKTDLEFKIQELQQREKCLSSQLSTVNEEKNTLASRSNELEVELEKQKCQYEVAQLAVKSLKKALLVSYFHE